jgi:hypothetical protein
LDVDRGLQIVGEIEMLEKELDAIETRLVQAGLDGDQVELVDPEREGRQYLAHGSAAIVPVVFTADLLIKSFANGSIVHGRIQDALGKRSIGDFFRRVTGFATQFDSGKTFRAHAAELLGLDAPKFISACLSRDKEGTPKSQIKVEWGRVEEVARASSLPSNNVGGALVPRQS